MGLRWVKGLTTASGERIVAARAAAPFRDLEDFLARTGLDRGALTRLAEAGALESLGVDRRQALWRVASPQTGYIATSAIRPDAEERGPEIRQLHLPLADDAPPPAFAPLSDLETITWDYGRTRHSPRGHPLAPLRDTLEELGLPTAAAINDLPDGRRLHYAGIVTCRQRPSNANGVTFMTLEDETGLVNVVVWRDLFDRHRPLARAEPFLGVSGRLQVHGEVTHLVAEELWRPAVPERPPSRRSRDFR